jgi:hypothetical protein
MVAIPYLQRCLQDKMPTTNLLASANGDGVFLKNNIGQSSP